MDEDTQTCNIETNIYERKKKEMKQDERLRTPLQNQKEEEH